MLAAASIRKADEIIAVSGFTAERIQARFARAATVIHEAPRRGFVIPTAAGVAGIVAKYQLPAQFVLYLGNFEPRKDLASLHAACRLNDVPLIIAGGAITTAAVPAGARQLGYVPDEDLPALFRAASVFGYVSRYEGFGLPPIEAMACGACVMATRTGALPEVARDGIEFVATGSVTAQASALRNLLQDPDRATERRAAAVREAGELSWSRAAAW